MTLDSVYVCITVIQLARIKIMSHFESQIHSTWIEIRNKTEKRNTDLFIPLKNIEIFFRILKMEQVFPGYENWTGGKWSL